MSWHPEPPVWQAYASGRLDPTAELSVETHLTACPHCRTTVAAQVPQASVGLVWNRVRDSVAVPTPSRVHRVLRRLGVREDDAVVVAAADALLVPWAAAVGLAVAAAVVTGFAGLGPAGQEAFFLAVAPLVPVLAVVVAHDVLDPLREVVAVSAYSALRLALLRAVASLAVAVPVTTALGLLLPGLDGLAVLWLAPGLGLTLAALVLLTWFEARVTGALLGLGWVGVVALLRLGGDVHVLTGPAAQVLFLVGAGALGLTLVLRTSSLRLQGGGL